ncbi:hypothetical protein JOQ06_025152 [Pogonophryne albipinna]|uniref:Amine oxidase domain-containing protein n=1 Tax=Pogonophryne albipinna TaxID=1090488 RepID=A0AAD6ATR6_9TELE|nr:hypothetical protein JOQ06_025152 [Pogonophryne albipinna]
MAPCLNMDPEGSDLRGQWDATPSIWYGKRNLGIFESLRKVDDLGLGGEILPVDYSHVASKNRYVYVNKQLHRMPSGIRLGKELADIAVDSLCRGVFAGDCRKLSVRSCFPVLFNAEQRRGSLTLGMLLGSGPTPALPPGPLAQRSQTESWAQWSLRSGMQSFPESLSEFLQQSGRVQLHRDAGVQHITPAASGWKAAFSRHTRQL